MLAITLKSLNDCFRVVQILLEDCFTGLMVRNHTWAAQVCVAHYGRCSLWWLLGDRAAEHFSTALAPSDPIAMEYDAKG